MKKLFIVIAFFAITFGATAQTKDTLKTFAGFMFVPQGQISVSHPNKGFTAFYPLYVVMTFAKGNYAVTPLYSLTYNLVGVAVHHDFSKTLGMYIVGNKKIFTNNGYTGIGFDRPVANGRASAFVEIGQVYGTGGGTFMYTGVFIPLTWKLK